MWLSIVFLFLHFSIQILYSVDVIER